MKRTLLIFFSLLLAIAVAKAHRVANTSLKKIGNLQKENIEGGGEFPVMMIRKWQTVD